MFCQVGEGLGVLHNIRINLKSYPYYQDFHSKFGAFAQTHKSPFYPSFVVQSFKSGPQRKGFAAQVVRLRADHHWKFMEECSQPDLLNGDIKSHRQAPRWLPPRYIQQVYMNRLFQTDVD